MASEELLDYIRKALAAGQNRNDITLNLVTSGWAGGEIDEAFLQFESPHASASSSPPPFAKSNNSLPSIKILFKESWQLFKATLIPLMKLMGLVFVGGVILIVIITAIVVLLNVYKINPLSFNQTPGSSNIASTLLTIFIVLFTLAAYLFLIFVIAPVIQIASVMILNSSGKLPIRTIIKNSRVMAIPFFLTTAFAGLIISGGMFAFIIPGIYFATIFMFVQYAIVIDGQKGAEALKKSYLLVKGRFWQTFFKLLGVYVITIAISLVIQIISTTAPVISLVFIILNIFINWFIACYTFLLYQHAKTLPVFSGPIRMGWVWVTVAIGWVAIIALFAFTLFSINPEKQFAQANNTKRNSDVNAIANALGQFAADNDEQIPSSITGDEMIISKSGADICSMLVPTYIEVIPIDPKTGDGSPVADCDSDYDTGYAIIKNEDGSITISAPNSELSEKISVTR